MKRLSQLLFIQAGVAAILLAQTPAGEAPGFSVQDKERKNTPVDLIRQFEAPAMESYELDDGDELTVSVWGRPELTGKQVIGPDGKISLPLAGQITLSGKTREQARDAIAAALTPYYENLAVTVTVDRYSSYRILILGRVGNPGALLFDRQPTLLDVLTRAAGLPIGGIGADKAALARCAIFRGRDKIIWIDLKPLLSQGQLDLNIRLARNDVVYLPDADDQLVYVLGYVKTPGAYHLTPTMSFLDALSLAGGPTEDAAPSKMALVRTSNGASRQVSLEGFIKGTSKSNFSLEEGDILYVPARGLAKFGYVLQKLSPLTGFAIIGTIVKP